MHVQFCGFHSLIHSLFTICFFLSTLDVTFCLFCHVLLKIKQILKAVVAWKQKSIGLFIKVITTMPKSLSHIQYTQILNSPIQNMLNTQILHGAKYQQVPLLNSTCKHWFLLHGCVGSEWLINVKLAREFCSIYRSLLQHRSICFYASRYFSHMSMFANNALLGGGVRVRVWIREQRKIKRRSKALLSLW